MSAIKFICKTNNKANHEEIRRRIFSAYGSIVREKIYRDTAKEFEGLFEITSEGGTLYKDIKESNLTTSITLI